MLVLHDSVMVDVVVVVVVAWSCSEGIRGIIR